MNIGNKTTNPGEMRTKISVLQRTVSSDAGNFNTPGTSLLASVWAKWTNVHGAEAWAAQASQANMPATVLIRYLAGVDTTCLVQKGSDLYEIVSIDDIQERHEYLELKVQRTAEG